MLKTCPACGVKSEERTALVELGHVVARMKEVTSEVLACTTDDARWWALQDEFSALMARSDALWEAIHGSP